jgi:hypothetical protein
MHSECKRKVLIVGTVYHEAIRILESGGIAICSTNQSERDISDSDRLSQEVHWFSSKARV